MFIISEDHFYSKCINKDSWRPCLLRIIDKKSSKSLYRGDSVCWGNFNYTEGNFDREFYLLSGLTEDCLEQPSYEFFLSHWESPITKFCSISLGGIPNSDKRMFLFKRRFKNLPSLESKSFNELGFRASLMILRNLSEGRSDAFSHFKAWGFTRTQSWFLSDRFTITEFCENEKFFIEISPKVPNVNHEVIHPNVSYPKFSQRYYNKSASRVSELYSCNSDYNGEGLLWYDYEISKNIPKFIFEKSPHGNAVLPKDCVKFLLKYLKGE